MKHMIERPSRPHDPTVVSSSPSGPSSHHSGRNVLQLLAQREICPRSKQFPKRLWGGSSEQNAESFFGPKSEAARDARRGLISWVEADSLQHLSARYCPLMPPPRSTIAAAFSPDGKTLASTHGDHTVKIIDCHTGSCLKVLTGHRRTPWVVRFHPVHPEILASGSLDHEVRIWDANTAECIGSRDFYRPIASIAFHAKGELLAVASGHKLFVWHYSRRGETSSPTIILKTRRSLRAVHFHPHGAPVLLTAEVNDLDSSDSSMTRATSPGYLHYPPPAVFLANIHSSDRLKLASELHLASLPFSFIPSFARDDTRIDLYHTDRPTGSTRVQMGSSGSVQFQADANAAGQYDYMVFPMETSPVLPSCSNPSTEGTQINCVPNGMENGIPDPKMDAMDSTEMQPVEQDQHRSSANLDTFSGANSASRGVPGHISSLPESIEFGHLHQFLPCRGPKYWELPFLQGWLMGQSQAGVSPMLSLNGASHEHSSQNLGMGSAILNPDLSTSNIEVPVISPAMAGSINLPGVAGRSGQQQRFSRSHLISVSESVEQAASINIAHEGSDTPPIMSRIQSELAASLAAAAAAELPCTVKLRIWSHDLKNPSAVLNAEKCLLIIPHAVLCSEMGAHLSPCGRFLAACVACVLPHLEADPGLQTQVQDVIGASTSPTRHPVSAHHVMYELRIYSLEEATFGTVLVSRAIRAAHCLTSIQFSPTSEHILLAYGRRHSSLLKSLVIDGETTLPIYTILEVYRVSDMELVRVLPSAEDEVNVACFHPLPGGGLVYGTKEGKLRVLQYDVSHGMNSNGPNSFLGENLAELEQYPRFRQMLSNGRNL